MIDFKNYFADEYQLTLKNVSYSWIENDSQGTNLDLHIADQIHVKIENNQLEASVDRAVFFVPESLYKIIVSFTFILTFREDQLTEEAKKMNWEEALVTNDNPYMANILSRASALISALTSAYGQQPIITPPTFVH